MEASNSGNIPSANVAVLPTDPVVYADDEELLDAGPSVPAQQTVNQTTVEHVRSTNTYSLELPVLLLFFSWNLSGTVFQNQVLYQSCILNYNESTCSLLANEEIPDNLVVIWVLRTATASTIMTENNHFFSSFCLLAGLGGRAGRVCIQNIYGSCCFRKYHSGVYKFSDRTVVR